jgi:hypothetical protein
VDARPHNRIKAVVMAAGRVGVRHAESQPDFSQIRTDRPLQARIAFFGKTSVDKTPPSAAVRDGVPLCSCVFLMNGLLIGGRFVGWLRSAARRTLLTVAGLWIASDVVPPIALQELSVRQESRLTKRAAQSNVQLPMPSHAAERAGGSCA